MDEASLRSAAIKYLEYLPQRVVTLKEQAANPAAAVEKPPATVEEDDSVKQALPEIKATVCNRDVLVRIHCRKRKGVIVSVIAELERKNLSIVNLRAAPFGCSAIDITILAEMEEEFGLPRTADVLEALQSALQAQS